ncbi:hypothetical protein ACFLYA_00375 [Candidatus Dependentiae bacterium]
MKKINKKLSNFIVFVILFSFTPNLSAKNQKNPIESKNKTNSSSKIVETENSDKKIEDNYEELNEDDCKYKQNLPKKEKKGAFFKKTFWCSLATGALLVGGILFVALKGLSYAAPMCLM